METVQLAQVAIKVQRSPKRKTLSIQVKPEQVKVLAPAWLDKDQIDQFVWQKQDWITAKLNWFADRHTCAATRLLAAEDQVLFLGEWVTLIIQPSSVNQVALKAKQLQVTSRQFPLSESQLEQRLQRWFRQQAQRILIPRCQALATNLQLQPSEISVRSYRARWGSCNSQGKISLNYWLVMAPAHVVDYVIIHELCHLKYMNHSSQFWQLVARYCPDYANAKKWLKQDGHRLSLQIPM